MPRTYRRFESTFKRHVVEQIESGRLNPTQAARDYQIARSLIERWREQYRNNGLAESPSRRERQLEEENEKLKAKIGDLIMEMDHIKKWQAWVQRQKSADTSVITAKNLDQFRKPAK
jgi:transposase-like protein